MNKYYKKIDPKTGRFLPLKKGEKSEKMLKKEIELGIKFENDYKKLYLTGELSQRKFSRRWGASKNLIFGRNLRGGRRSWEQMLNLSSNNKSVGGNVVTSRAECELCGVSDVSLDNAHWVENFIGGDTKSYNILKLCPNCHRRLDRADQVITEHARATLLLRVVKKIIDSRRDERELKVELLMRVEAIILNRRSKFNSL